MKLFSRSKSQIPLLEEASARFSDEKRNTTMAEILAFLFKRSAKHLKTHLERQHGLDLSHGQALNAVSSCLGFADWNTTSATLRGISDEYDRLDAPPVPPQAQPPRKTSSRPRMLADALDFNTNSLVVGAAGSGKTCGLIFAAQRARVFGKGRPVLIVRGAESIHYQPNWGAALAVFNNTVTLETLDQTAAPHKDDKLEVSRPDTHRGLPDQEQTAWRISALETMLAWLENRKHLNPLVVIEEAHSVLEVYSTAFLRNIPAQATIVWSTQSLHDLYDMELVAERFREIHLMKHSLRSAGPSLTNTFKNLNIAKLLPKVEQLSVGEVVTLDVPLPSEPADKLR